MALAQHVAGSVKHFVTRMNAEAAKLGMGCTHYSSPSGYYDERNYSCAADLALLAHADLQQPRLASIVRTYTAVLPFPIKGGRLYLYNNNPLLIYSYPGVTGMKTGYTEAAGRCLVATAERHGVRLGVVLMHSPDPGQAGELPAEPRLRRRLPPSARPAAADPGRHLSSHTRSGGASTPPRTTHPSRREYRSPKRLTGQSAKGGCSRGSR